jgi:4-hydroxy-tetrahydrodipicolinate synthase
MGSFAMMRFTGIWVPLVTPFQDGNIDFSALRALACRLADAGVAGLVVCGSTGEAAALSDDEQLTVLDIVLESVPGCPVVMGLAGNNMQDVLDRLRRFNADPFPAYWCRRRITFAHHRPAC